MNYMYIFDLSAGSMMEKIDWLFDNVPTENWNFRPKTDCNVEVFIIFSNPEDASAFRLRFGV